ncbi:hypothetical protein Nos7524_4147 [Nostoc sp. PCC 7524]|uniref:hypothetical protein n=1 Tax=Nostoc sp. (strain ATCC 29411 / PCC 7524) TaxID=28072 RepID=UPI00029EFCC4|nr:hypothetical protein [Nostoc sp. PCC 7524]AFY49916.1 hypothetical protein Nos7524_4147 [Nostoc sp. PCC 7524]
MTFIPAKSAYTAIKSQKVADFMVVKQRRSNSMSVGLVSSCLSDNISLCYLWKYTAKRK